MKNKMWKTSRKRWEMWLCFVFIVCFLMNKFQVCQGTKNDLPDSATDVVLSDEKQEIEQYTTESSQYVFVSEKNSTRPWVPKCCHLNYGFTFENKSICVETEDEFLPDFEDRPDYSETTKNLPVKTRYEYYIGDPCLDGKYILDLTAYPDDQYSVYSNGTLFYLDELYSKEEFCLETLNGTVRAFVCFGAGGKSKHELDFTFVIYAVALLISIPFLLATALIHTCIEMFRDVRGKSLSCHVLCLAIGYLVLAIVQLTSNQLNEGLCIAAGFIIQFFFVASFFWLNVICFDTWRCINNDFRCTIQPINLRSEKMTFCSYSLYGWYGPVMLSIASLIMDLEPAIPESYLKPNFGLRSCWFYSDDAALPYFYGPVAFLIFVNVIFFILSARKIYLVQKGQEETKRSGRNVSIRLYIKTLQECIYFFCIMGINWAAEVISWAVGGSQMIWLITDIFNALQGVMIFYLFVLEPDRVRNELKRRLCLLWKKIISCDCHYQEENKRTSRHWHADFCYATENEVDFNNEHDKFLSQPNTTAV